MYFPHNRIIYVLALYIILPLILSSVSFLLTGCIVEQENLPDNLDASQGVVKNVPANLHSGPTSFNHGLTESVPDLDLIAAASRLQTSPIKYPPVDKAKPMVHVKGTTQDFWLTDIASSKTKRIQATLIAVSNNAYWYFDKGLSRPPPNLKDAITAFELDIVPEFDKTMPIEMGQGIDHDPKVTILHTYFEGAAGYFNSFDRYPEQINPYSNQQSILYMNLNYLELASSAYLGTLSHELQHMRHSMHDPTEESWVNEGISEVMRNLSGYRPGFLNHFITAPTTQLNYWPSDKTLALPHYGASTLFIDYLLQNYGGYSALKTLVSMPADGIEGIDQYLSSSGFKEGFDEIFDNWALANFLDSFEEPPYNYPFSNVQIMPTRKLDQGSSILFKTPQYSTEYILLETQTYPSTLSFQGAPTVQLIPPSVFSGSGCWWSNRGDFINTSLTGPLDLTLTDSPVLAFWMWYDIEKDWDYLYLSVSEDDGSSWTAISTKHMSQNPSSGASLSPGYTGASNGWERHSIDLSRYSGTHILVRFEYITDQSVNESGVCIDNLSLSGVGIIEDAESSTDWVSSGFIRIDNLLRQNFALHVIELGEGQKVTKLEVDETGEATFDVLAPQEEATIIVVVSPTTKKTSVPAEYKLSLTAR